MTDDLFPPSAAADDLARELDRGAVVVVRANEFGTYDAVRLSGDAIRAVADLLAGLPPESCQAVDHVTPAGALAQLARGAGRSKAAPARTIVSSGGAAPSNPQAVRSGAGRPDPPPTTPWRPPAPAR